MGEDSLARRLAGQSVGKAGLAVDQTEINRIIAEASKGSKFYENERKKDAELTDKIAGLLLKKDELMKGADIIGLEAAVDRQISELEATRDLSQIIVHVDCDAFYASVEVLDDPSLEGKAFGVSPGVLTTASYEARKYGVRSAMPAFIAKKLCPHLIIVPLHFDRYKTLSDAVMDILRTRDPNLSIMSMDEAYLNITDYCRVHQLTPDECVQQLRDEVRETTKLTVSAGIAPNKLLAKICSDKNKPNGQYKMDFTSQSIIEFMRDLPVRKVPGIGKVSERLLQSFGLQTCGDIYTHRAVISIMDHWLGLPSLLEAYLGLGSNHVHPGRREERKSVGAERTFHATNDLQRLLHKLDEIAASLEADLERTGFVARTITLKYKLDTFKLFTRAKSCQKWIKSKDDLFEIGKELLMKEWPVKLRLIGLQASHLKDLRVSAETGIMKFLARSPNGGKRRKMSDDPYILISEDEDGDLPGAGFLTAAADDHPTRDEKPNFFDSDDNEVPVASSSAANMVQSKPRSYAGDSTKPYDGPSRSVISSSTKVKPVSVSAVPRETSGDGHTNTSRDDAHILVCPICNCGLETDNAGLNAHVDFCLSRGAIFQASAMGDASSSQEIPEESRTSGKAKKRKNPFVGIK